MIWHPTYTANGWWPKLSYPWLAHGAGECWLVNMETGEHRQIGAGLGRYQPAGWLDATTLVYYYSELPATVFAQHVTGGAVRTLWSGNVNRVCARGGSWATGLAAGGVVTLNGQEIARGVGWRVDVDGDVLACQSNAGLHTWLRGEAIPVAAPQTTLVDPQVRGGWVGYGYNGPALAYNVHSGADLDVTVTPWRKEHAPVVVDGWIWTTTERPDGTSAAIGRPVGDDTCLVLECASAVALDVQRVNDDWVVATSGTRGELLVQTVRVDAPRVTIAPMDPPAVVQPIAPFAHHFHAACYKDPSLKAPANVIFAPEPLMAPITGPAIVGPFRKTLDCAVGWTLAIEDVEAARTAALACKAIKDLPVYAYLGGYVPEARIDGIDVPLLQAYRLPGRETAAAILAQLRADITHGAYPRVGIAVDLTDRTLPGVGGWPEADRLAFLVGIADLCREIQPAAVIAWAWNRPAPQAGLSSSAIVTAQWRRFVEAIPAPVDPPPVEPDPPVIPEVPMQPYDESLVYATNEKVRALYAAAGHVPDDQYPIWTARCTYDYCAGLSWPASETKHLQELRGELGLVTPTPPTPPASTLPRLRVNGHVFEQETGAPFTAIQCSDFNLLCRFQSGQDITPILAQRRAAGFNMLRVWTLYSIPNIGHFLDIDYHQVGPFLRLCASYGLYVEFTAYTSTEYPYHWDRLVEAVKPEPNALVELVNEGTIPVNRIDMSRYARPSGILASHGSGGAEGDPPWEPWDYITFHTNGADEEQRKVGKQPYDLAETARRPVLANETSRFPEVGMWVGATPERRRHLAYDSARGAALLCAGSCFHAVQGKTSVLFDADTLDAAVAWTTGARSVPLAVQHEAYTRRDDLLTPELLRVYQRGTSEVGLARIRT